MVSADYVLLLHHCNVENLKLLIIYVVLLPGMPVCVCAHGSLEISFVKEFVEIIWHYHDVIFFQRLISAS
jgi:hypothetical protein